MINHNNELQKAVQRAKADIAKKYVFVHMHIPQLETILAGLEEANKRVEELEKELVAHKCPDCAVTGLEYCPEHHSARTDIWSGGDGW